MTLVLSPIVICSWRAILIHRKISLLSLLVFALRKSIHFLRHWEREPLFTCIFFLKFWLFSQVFQGWGNFLFSLVWKTRSEKKKKRISCSLTYSCIISLFFPILSFLQVLYLIISYMINCLSNWNRRDKHIALRCSHTCDLFHC